jgi:thioredoxin 1
MKPAVSLVAVAAMLAAAALSAVACADEGSTSSSRPQSKAGTRPGHATPRLVDLGAGTCLPCKAMAPILEGLKAEYAGRMEVQFIDVWKDGAAAAAYGIRIIPTQIFFGADGKELARHEGFMGKDEILARWKAVGVSF